MTIDQSDSSNTASPLSVSDMIALFQSSLSSQIPFLRVTGEISEVSRPSSGHLYLTLSDCSSSFPVVMWRGAVRELAFQVQSGLAVIVEGKPAIYGANGKLQLIANRILAVGDGILQQRFRELRNKLESEGLFSPARKRGLPLIPKAIGIVTSSSGAAIQDILVRLNDRMPNVPKFLIDVRVQGQGSAEEIARAIAKFNKLKNCDVIIIGRGGGSLEDLWAFNEEIVVRAIFKSEIPIISAVGHEIDITLSDLVADVRAPTPTAAGEIVVPKASALLDQVRQSEKRLQIVGDRIGLLTQHLDEVSRRLQIASKMGVQQRHLSLAGLDARVRLVSPRSILEANLFRIKAYVSRLTQCSLAVLQAGETSVLQLENRPRIATMRRMDLLVSGVESCRDRLRSLHPHRTLERGYSITRMRGSVISSSTLVPAGERIEVQLAHGRISADVIVSKE